MNKDQLAKIAQAMVSKGKGILAADESTGTIQKRFEAIGVSNTETNRRDYREFMFRTEDAMREHISAVILFDETIRQKAKDGTPLVKIIESAGAVPGIKVDQGAKPMPLYPNETITEGLDGLAKRLQEYYQLGARFAKWRAVINIDAGAGSPTMACIKANAHALARYAAHCQNTDIVPIVEPEVLMDGDHPLMRCYEVTEAVLKAVFSELYEARVFLEGSILKPNMVVPGKKFPDQADPRTIAEQTLRVLKNYVPVAVPGIAFLSGGQSDIEATANLNAIHQLGPLPWAITFSYGRALQAAPQKAWSGQPANVVRAQRAFRHRARMNGLATMGRWTEAVEAA
jgi:fructose-bisphosphate aldolase class I